MCPSLKGGGATHTPRRSHYMAAVCGISNVFLAGGDPPPQPLLLSPFLRWVTDSLSH